MKKGIVVVFLMIISLALAVGSALAAPDNMKFNWGNEVNLSKCDKGKLVVNIIHDVTNSADSRVGGGYWAVINYKKFIQIVQTDENTFCVVTKYIGEFETLEGRSPANQADISAGITGTLQGGYRQIYTGSLIPDPIWATKGYVGSFDHGYPNLDGSVDDWEDIYLNPGWSKSWEWWGFIYHGGRNGTWINSMDGNQGDITD